MTSAPTKPNEALRAARELLTPEGAWTKQALAFSADGKSVNPSSDEAVCWCVSGALFHTNGEGPTNSLWDFVELAIGGNIASWNDDPNRTHSEVLSALDCAIALAESSGQ
jgi:hypothetical protein